MRSEQKNELKWIEKQRELQKEANDKESKAKEPKKDDHIHVWETIGLSVSRCLLCHRTQIESEFVSYYEDDYIITNNKISI